MFETDSSPHIYGVPPGVDFPRALLAGLHARLKGAPPDALARVEIFVNTRRMQRRLKALFDSGAAALLPRVRLITDPATDRRFEDITSPISPLRRRPELTSLIGRLLEKEPGPATRSAPLH